MTNILRSIILVAAGLLTASCVYDPRFPPGGVVIGGPPPAVRPVGVVTTNYHRPVPGHAPYRAVVRHGEPYRGPGGPAARHDHDNDRPNVRHISEPKHSRGDRDDDDRKPPQKGGDSKKDKDDDRPPPKKR